MKKLKLIKDGEIGVKKEFGHYCDYCGDKEKQVFTSSYIDNPDCSANELQICEDCITQLFKLI
jgi:hypothetical protein